MKVSNFRILVTAARLLIAAFLFGAGLTMVAVPACTSKAVKSEPVAMPDVLAVNGELQVSPVSDRDLLASLRVHVYFDLDQAEFRPDASPTMLKIEQYLSDNPSLKVRIEGNCDDRGSIEYNMGLGLRRALAPKSLLESVGISSDRISVSSFGKENPVCNELTEQCRQENRRADFILY